MQNLRFPVMGIAAMTTGIAVTGSTSEAVAAVLGPAKAAASPVRHICRKSLCYAATELFG
jgi:hypothetical protein